MESITAKPLDPKGEGRGSKIDLSQILSWNGLLLPTILSISLASLSLYNYSLFHIAIELFAVVIAFIIFALGWLSHAFTKNTQLNYLICGYLGIGVLDLLHAFTFPELKILPVSGVNTTIYFWLSARFLEVSVFLLAAFFVNSQTKKTTILLGVVLYLSCVISFSFYINTATLFFDEDGLTASKILSEYLIIVLSIITLRKMMNLRHSHLNGGRGFIIVSLMLTICSEFLFTTYFSIYDFSNLIGHVLKLFSFWFVFNAVVITNLNIPFDDEKKSKLLYKKLYESVPTPIWIADLSTLNETLSAAKQQNLLHFDQQEENRSTYSSSNLLIMKLRTGNLESKRHFAFLSNTNLLEAIAEGERERFIELLKSQWAADNNIRISTKLLDGNGKVLHVIIGLSVPNNTDDITSIPISIYDITEQITSISVREKANRALGNASINVISALSQSLLMRDPYTSTHQSRVVKLAVEIGRESGWNEFKLEGLRLGASIHDIGKIKVPMEILNRPGKISSDEFSVIKAHPEVGAQILEEFDFPWPIKEMVEQHHERLDGTGYPNGLAGKEIIDEARVISIADVVEAITSHRPYRPALGIEEGLKEIKDGMGTLYDPEYAEICIQLIESKRFTWEND